MLPPIVHGVKIKWDWNGCTNSDKTVGLCASFWDYLPLLFQSQVFHSILAFPEDAFQFAMKRLSKDVNNTIMQQI